MNSNFDFGRKFSRLKRDLSEGLLTPLRELLSDELIGDFLHEAGCAFRIRIYTPIVTFWAFLSQALGPAKSCRAAVTQVLAGVTGAPDELPSEDTGAYCRARKRLPEPVLEKLVSETGRRAEAYGAGKFLWHGRRVKIVDGTCVSMPDNEQLSNTFGVPAKKRWSRGFPVAKIVALISLATGVVIDAAIGPYRKHERELFRELWRSLAAEDIVMGDRGFGSYAEIFELQKRGVDCVFRMNARRKVDRRCGKKLGHQDHLLTWQRPNHLPKWVPSAKSLPETLSVRVIDYQIETPGFRSRRIIVATTLIDPEKYSREDVAKLYGLRWTIEVDLRHLKSTMGMDVLRGRSADIVRKEIWMHLIAYNLIRHLMLQSALQENVDPNRLSVKGTIDRVRAWTNPMNVAPVCALKRLYSGLLKTVARDLVPERPDRIEPRAVKRGQKGYPTLTVPRAQARQYLLKKRA